MSVFKDVELYFIVRHDTYGRYSMPGSVYKSKAEAVADALDFSVEKSEVHVVYKTCHLGVIEVGKTARSYGLSLYPYVWEDSEEHNQMLAAKMKEFIK